MGLSMECRFLRCRKAVLCLKSPWEDKNSATSPSELKRLLLKNDIHRR